MSTLRETLKAGEERLRQAGVPDAAHDAWELFADACEMEKSCYFLHENDKIKEIWEKRYGEMIEKRAQRIPLQQILGTAWFMGYEFAVNEQVLTPRFDTEILVEEAARHLKPGMKILDVCTGSGCILLSLLAEYRDMELTGLGVDLSAGALSVAKENQKRLAIEAEFIQSDLLEKVTGVYDLIVSNPPYIATKEMENLMPEVREHEPWMALDGKEDGLFFYRKIVEAAGGYLKKEGWLCFEIGYDQGEAVRRMMEDAGYEKVSVIRDLAGLDRVVQGQWTAREKR